MDSRTGLASLCRSLSSPLLPPSHRKPKMHFSTLMPWAVEAGEAHPESPAAEELGAPTLLLSASSDLAFHPQPPACGKRPAPWERTVPAESLGWGSLCEVGLLVRPGACLCLLPKDSPQGGVKGLLRVTPARPSQESQAARARVVSSPLCPGLPLI